MKRYKKLKIRIPIPDEGSFGAIDIDSKMKEHPEGEWVRYEDYKSEFFRITEMYENRIRELKKNNMAGLIKKGKALCCEVVSVQYKVDSWEALLVEVREV